MCNVSHYILPLYTILAANDPLPNMRKLYRLSKSKRPKLECLCINFSLRLSYEVHLSFLFSPFYAHFLGVDKWETCTILLFDELPKNVVRISATQRPARRYRWTLPHFLSLVQRQRISSRRTHWGRCSFNAPKWIEMSTWRYRSMLLCSSIYIFISDATRIWFPLGAFESFRTTGYRAYFTFLFAGTKVEFVPGKQTHRRPIRALNMQSSFFR